MHDGAVQQATRFEVLHESCRWLIGLAATVNEIAFDRMPRRLASNSHFGFYLSMAGWVGRVAPSRADLDFF